MSKRICIAILAALVGVGRAWAGDPLPSDVSDAFRKASRFTVYSLHPHPWREDRGFHSFRVRSQVGVSDPVERERIAAAVAQSVSAAEMSSYCFKPRHGIRLVSEGRTTDLVICYECGLVRIYATGREERGSGIGGDSGYLDRLLAGKRTARRTP